MIYDDLRLKRCDFPVRYIQLPEGQRVITIKPVGFCLTTFKSFNHC